jgi:acylphosphatase
MRGCRRVLSLLLVAGALAAGREAVAMAEDTSQPRDRAVARLVHYSGRVQGVGFRATTAGIAQGHPVTGYVRNVPDGRVELLAEGSPEAVRAFLEAVRTRWKRYIDKENVQEQPAAGKYRRFEITR